MQDTTEIPREAWNTFFSRFSDDHEMQVVAVEIMGSDIGAQVEGQSLLLDGISPGDPEGPTPAGLSCRQF